MAQIYLRHGSRCQEHPHRAAHERCDRCGLPYCAECLSPTERRPDGSRDWICAACAALVGETAAHRAYQRSFRVRARRAIHTGRRTGAAAAVLVLAATTLAAVAIPLSRMVPRTTASTSDPNLDARCGELSRIRSVGAIGTQAGEDAVNVLTYPQRAGAQLVDAAAPGPTQATAIQTLTDECDAGWRHESPLTLPASLVLDTGRQGSYVQRVALWQDPTAPRDSWVRDFELLVSTGKSGDDFQPVTLDRPAQLRESTEPQWFEVVRPAPGGLSAPFPDVIEARRLQVRILSTYGSFQAAGQAAAQPARPRPHQAPRVALGEVAAYGPDLEINVDHPNSEGGKNRSAFTFGPPVINALSSRPKFVLFFNRTTSAEPHHIVSVGQERNLDVRLGLDQARSGQFIAGRPGRYEFVCRTPGHAQLGLTGTIIVR